MPYGGIAAPAGKTWHIYFDDEFLSDTDINTSLWNGPTGNGNPICYPSGTPGNICGTGLFAGNEIIGDCFGFAGYEGSECFNRYNGSTNGHNWGDYVVSGGAGLYVQAYPAPYTDPNPTFGAGQYFDNIWAGLQNYGKWPTTTRGYFEWKAKMPTDVSGEGDGYHYDLWCTTNNRATLSNGAEVDVAESVAGRNNHTTVGSSLFDGPGLQPWGILYGSVGADLTQSYHVYGLFWDRTQGGSQGQMSVYVDGHRVAGPASITSSDWATGIYCFAGWEQANASNTGVQRPFNGGWPLSASTSYSDPVIVQYFRAWQYSTSPSTPPPTTSGAPTCHPVFTAPASGSTASGTVHVSVTPNCNAAATSCGYFVRQYLPDGSQSDNLGASYNLNTLKYPQGTAKIAAQTYSIGCGSFSGQHPWGTASDSFTIN